MRAKLQLEIEFTTGEFAPGEFLGWLFETIEKDGIVDYVESLGFINSHDNLTLIRTKDATKT